MQRWRNHPFLQLTETVLMHIYVVICKIMSMNQIVGKGMYMRLIEDESSIYEIDEECIRRQLEERENAQPEPLKNKDELPK